MKLSKRNLSRLAKVKGPDHVSKYAEKRRAKIAGTWTPPAAVSADEQTEEVVR